MGNLWGNHSGENETKILPRAGRACKTSELRLKAILSLWGGKEHNLEIWQILRGHTVPSV